MDRADFVLAGRFDHRSGGLFDCGDFRCSPLGQQIRPSDLNSKPGIWNVAYHVAGLNMAFTITEFDQTLGPA